jgi:hypothetical protein
MQLPKTGARCQHKFSLLPPSAAAFASLLPELWRRSNNLILLTLSSIGWAIFRRAAKFSLFSGRGGSPGGVEQGADDRGAVDLARGLLRSLDGWRDLQVGGGGAGSPRRRCRSFRRGNNYDLPRQGRFAVGNEERRAFPAVTPSQCRHTAPTDLGMFSLAGKLATDRGR